VLKNFQKKTEVKSQRWLQSLSCRTVRFTVRPIRCSSAQVLTNSRVSYELQDDRVQTSVSEQWRYRHLATDWYSDKISCKATQRFKKIYCKKYAQMTVLAWSSTNKLTGVWTRLFQVCLSLISAVHFAHYCTSCATIIKSCHFISTSKFILCYKTCPDKQQQSSLL
jgi:hypothetical protein